MSDHDDDANSLLRPNDLVVRFPMLQDDIFEWWLNVSRKRHLVRVMQSEGDLAFLQAIQGGSFAPHV